MRGVSTSQLYLVTPLVGDPEPFAPALQAACAAGGVAAVLLRLEPADERTLVKRVKALAPLAQEHGAAVLVMASGEADLVTVAARGGADGVHAGGADPAALLALRERLKDERILGAGALRSRDDAMNAGEAGVDYVIFGEPRPDGFVPPLDQVAERAAWWAEIFQTPCVAYAPSLDAVTTLAATGAEFVGVGEHVWTHPDGPGAAVRAAAEAIEAAEAPE